MRATSLPLLFDVPPAAPITIGASALVFGAIALAACLAPGMRAARVDLMSALHND